MIFLGSQNNALATTELTTDQLKELKITSSSEPTAVFFKLGTDFTAIQPRVGDLRIQDKDDSNDSDFIQFRVDDNLGRVEISSPNFFKFLHDLVIKPSGAAAKAILIRDHLDTQDNININQDGSIDLRSGIFPLINLTGNLGSITFQWLNAYIQNLFIAALTASGAISGDSLSITNNAHIQGKLQVDGAIDPTELDMPDNAPIYLDTAKTKSLKWNSTTSKIDINGKSKFFDEVEVEGLLDHAAEPNKPKIFNQALEPDIPNNSMAFWWDTDDSKMYLILDLSGTQYKVQLT